MNAYQEKSEKVSLNKGKVNKALIQECIKDLSSEKLASESLKGSFEIGTIENVFLDTYMLCSENKYVIGRPWLTLLIDGYSRRILGSHISFEPPSLKSCIMVIHDCLEKNSKLPKSLVCDFGSKFHNEELNDLLRKNGSEMVYNRSLKLGVEKVFRSIDEKLSYRENQVLTRNPKRKEKSQKDD